MTLCEEAMSIVGQGNAVRKCGRPGVLAATIGTLVILLLLPRSVLASSQQLFGPVESEATGRPTYFAGVGINDYTDWPNLRGAGNDLKNVITALEGYDIVTHPSVPSYPDGFLLRDSAATMSAIRNMVIKFAKYAAADSANVIFYFAGHGMDNRDWGGSPQQAYLIPHDGSSFPQVEEDIEFGEAPAVADAKWLPLEELLRPLKHGSLGQVLVIVDACRAGTFSARPLESYADSIGTPTREIVTAAAYGLNASEIPWHEGGNIKEYGVFSKALSDALRELARTHDGDDIVTSREIVALTRERMKKGIEDGQLPVHGRFEERAGPGLFALVITDDHLTAFRHEYAKMAGLFADLLEHHDKVCDERALMSLPEGEGLRGIAEYILNYEAMAWYSDWVCAKPERTLEEEEFARLKALGVQGLIVRLIAEDWRGNE